MIRKGYNYEVNDILWKVIQILCSVSSNAVNFLVA